MRDPSGGHKAKHRNSHKTRKRQLTNMWWPNNFPRGKYLGIAPPSEQSCDMASVALGEIWTLRLNIEGMARVEPSFYDCDCRPWKRSAS